MSNMKDRTLYRSHRRDEKEILLSSQIGYLV